MGRISMDTTLVDVTEVPAARAGDEVELFGARGEASPALPDQDAREQGYAATLATALAAVDDKADDPALGRTAPGHGSIAVEEVASWAGTIPHEILCRIGIRVPRRYEQQGGAVDTVSESP